LVEDLLHPLESTERSKHKLKRLVQGPNSFFMDVKCPGFNFYSFLFLLFLYYYFRIRVSGIHNFGNLWKN